MAAAARGGQQRRGVNASGVWRERGAEGSTFPRTESALIAKVN